MKQPEDVSPAQGLSATADGASEPQIEDERIIAALHEYLAALEAGAAPDHAAFVARHPAIADELRDCLEGLDFVHGHGPRLGQLQDDAAPSSSEIRAECPLGDYRIVREIGRGGMGIVYEAVQLSLGRKVAVKVLPLVGALDPKQLQRFKNEAQAAAQLHHTNIVPVYHVGSERSVHFYAMQYIEGQSLAQIIANLKLQISDSTQDAEEPARPGAFHYNQSTGGMFSRPEFEGPGPAGSPRESMAPMTPVAPPIPETTRNLSLGATTERSAQGQAHFAMVARLGVQAADALEHAHQLGVIHRDIKPANLLVDTCGNLWVTDFGLALVQTQPGLTLTGDLVGTLRYMSPEQALAKRVFVDHRTDIYSLGVTLYELLTLQPAVPGPDRQEILRQIAFEEPRPPRRINKSIPPELETIVCKATEKNPAERYATAQELADDLRRFLEDKPIRAKPATLLHRVRKLARRNPGVAWMAVALLAVLAVGSAISTLVIAQQLHRAEKAEEDRGIELKRALAAEGEVKKHLARVQNAEQKASTNLEQAQRSLWQTKLAQAQVGHWSGRAGRAFHSLKALAEAAQIARSLKLPEEDMLKLRNEAIACLALTDLRRMDHWYRHVATPGMVIDPVGERYTTSDDQGNVILHRLADDQVILRLRGPGSRIGAASFSPDGRFLAAIYPLDRQQSPRGRILLWDLARKDVAFQLTPEVDGTLVRWSPDSTRFATRLQRGTIAVYDLLSRRLIQRFTGVQAHHVVFDPPGKQLAFGSGPEVVFGAEVQIHEIKTGQLVGRLSFTFPLGCLAWGADGRFLAIAPAGFPNVRGSPIWVNNVPDGYLHAILEGHTDTVTSLSFDHAGERLASTSRDGTLRLWDPWTAKELLRTHGGALGGGVGFTGDDRFLTTDAGHQWWFEVRTSRELRPLHSPDESKFWASYFGVNGRLLATGEAGHVRLWDLATFKSVAVLPGNYPAIFERNGKSVLTPISGGMLRWPITFAADENGERLRIGPPEQVDWKKRQARGSDEQMLAALQRGWHLSLDGRWAATGSRRGNGPKVWDARTGKLVRHLTSDDATSVCFSPDGKCLVTGSQKEYVFWEVGSWKMIRKIPRKNGSVSGHIAFSPDSQLLAISNSRWDVQLIDPRSGRELATLANAESASVGYLAFSGDGSRLAIVTQEAATAAPRHAALHVLDLRVLHEQLAEMGLDWDLPPRPPAKSGEQTAPAPLQVQLDPGEFLDADRYSLIIAFFPFHVQAYYQRGLAHARRLEPHQAIDDFNMTLALKSDHADAYYARELIRLSPSSNAPVWFLDSALAPTDDDHFWRNNLAWMLVTCPEPKLRNPSRALELAKGAVKLAPQRPHYWNTLGVAHYRAGNWSEAIEKLKKAEELGPDIHFAWNAFFIAMAYCRLAEKQQARAWYERAVSWMERNQPNVEQLREELRRFRAEAEELLAPTHKKK
jgi:serine/threonine protein kinase/WD40 repeat protein